MTRHRSNSWPTERTPYDVQMIAHARNRQMIEYIHTDPVTGTQTRRSDVLVAWRPSGARTRAVIQGRNGNRSIPITAVIAPD